MSISTSSPDSPARERWRAFLSQLAGRHRALGVEASQLVLREAKMPAAHAWLGLDSRMVELERKIIDTWNDKVEGAYEAEALPRELWWADLRLGEDLAFALENERAALQNQLFSDDAHATGWLAAQAEWLHMRRCDRALRQARSPRPLGLLQAYERAQIAYWRSYVSARAVHEPALRDVTHEVRSRMHGFYERTAEFEESWRDAGRPRAAI